MLSFAIRNYYNNSAPQAATHYVVDNKTLLQCVPDAEWCYHLGNPNQYRPAAEGLLKGEGDRRLDELTLAISLCDAEDSAPQQWAATPSQLRQLSVSPRKAAANNATSATLSLSIGATRLAGPNCSARK